MTSRLTISVEDSPENCEYYKTETIKFFAKMGASVPQCEIVPNVRAKFEPSTRSTVPGSYKPNSMMSPSRSYAYRSKSEREPQEQTDIMNPYANQPVTGGRSIGPALEAQTTAVLVIDIQRDFMEGGSISIVGADLKTYLPAVKGFLVACRARRLMIVHVKNKHAPGHNCFASMHGAEPYVTRTMTAKTRKTAATQYNQKMWPDHCVKNTKGADMMIEPMKHETVLSKGENPTSSCYSAFYDVLNNATGMEKLLNKNKVRDVIVFGLAGDYSVACTLADAVRCKYQAWCVVDLCRCLDSSFNMWQEFEKMGVQCVSTSQCYEQMEKKAAFAPHIAPQKEKTQKKHVKFVRPKA